MDEGEWKDGEFHGQGTYTWDDLNKYLSEWNDGVPVEQGIFPFLHQHCRIYFYITFWEKVFF